MLFSTQAIASTLNVAAEQKYGQVAEALEKMIQQEMKNQALPAVSIALVDNAKVVWAQGFGYADPVRKAAATADTIYRVGSVSKLFTDAAIMQLVEKGELDLDAPVTRYLPDFHPTNGFSKPITLRELMSHRSGLVREPPVGNYFDSTSPSLKATVESLNSTSLVYAPGTHTKYSNAAITVAGYILERQSGQRFPAYLQQAVLKPLDMESSALHLRPTLLSGSRTPTCGHMMVALSMRRRSNWARRLPGACTRRYWIFRSSSAHCLPMGKVAGAAC